jgi:MFS family permease
MTTSRYLRDLFHDTKIMKFFAQETNFCKFDGLIIHLIISIPYFIAVPFPFVCMWLSSKWGRRLVFQVATISFIMGVILNAFTLNFYFSFAGLAILGVGIGLYNQVEVVIRLDKIYSFCKYFMIFWLAF